MSDWIGHLPALGQHTVEVLREAGLDTGTIDALLASGVLAQAVEVSA